MLEGDAGAEVGLGAAVEGGAGRGEVVAFEGVVEGWAGEGCVCALG